MCDPAEPRLPPPDEHAVAALLRQAGLPGVFSWQRLPGGRNNRVWRIDASGKAAALKQYFEHPRDTRDRFTAELEFVRAACSHGVRCIPQPLACDRDRKLALYEFIHGDPVPETDVSAGRVGEALAFVRQLHRLRDTLDAAQLPPASEACFTISEHVRCIARRVGSLVELAASDGLPPEAQCFVSNKLEPTWQVVTAELNRTVRSEAFDPDARLPRQEMILSPSDFGFHNALIESSGRLRFLDFEYAGWDDPAKLLCDFFCQVEVPVPEEHWHAFVAGVVELLPSADRHRRRAEILVALYRIKWCCIVLNVFQAAGALRRSFSGAQANGYHANQLAKALQIHARIARDLERMAGVTPEEGAAS